MKAYPEYKDTGIEWVGNIPIHWSNTRIKTVVESVVNGVWGDEPQGDGNDVICVRVADFDMLKLGVGKEKLTTRNILESQQSGRLLNKDDLLIEKSGGGDTQPVGRVIRFDLDEKAVSSNFIGMISVNKSKVSPVFLLYYLSNLYSKAINTRSIKQTTGIQNLDTYSYFSERISLPPLSEQQAIMDFLDNKTAQIESLVEKKQKQIDLLQEQHTALINQAITKGLNPNVQMKDSGAEWLGEIPRHWKFVKTKYLFRLVTEKAPDDNGMELLSLYTEIGVRPRKDLEARGNKASTTDGYWIVKEGDIVINKLLAWMGAVGYSAYDGVTSPAYDVLRKTVPLNSKFYHYLLRCGVVLPEFKRRSRGIMEMRLRLYFDELGQIPLVYPPESEQNQIVEYLEDLEETVNRTISKITKEIELLQEYRMALISEAVTGKIDVRTAV